MTLDSFSFRFPLRLTLGGLSLVQQNDTIVAASELSASVALLPLLKGEAEVKDLSLSEGRFRMGNPDSAMFMTIAAKEIALRPVKIGLKNMAIDIESGTLYGARVGMVITPDTTASVSPASDPTEMSIRLGRLALHDFSYTMRLLPTIDSLGATISNGVLSDGLIDLKSQIVNLKEFSGLGLDVAYIAPDSTTIASTPVVATVDTVASAPWTIQIDSLDFSGSKALYTTRGLSPQPGLDFGYIAVDSLDLKVNNFYDQATTLRLPLKLKGRERCGVMLDASGEFALDSAAMYLKGFNLTTPTTDLAVDMIMGMGDLMSDPTIPLNLDVSGGLGVADARMMFPAYLPYLVTLPAEDQIGVNIDIAGTMGQLDINRLDVAISGCVNINGNGYVGNLTSPDNLMGDITLSGNVINLNRIKNSMLSKDAAKDINIPRMALNGNVKMRSGTIDGRLNVRTGAGKLALDGKWNSRREDYSASLSVKDFPIETFMPNLGAADVTADLKATGHGYDPFVPTMKADVNLNINSARYEDYTYRDIYLSANIADGKGRATLHSDNPDTRIQLMAEGNLYPQPYDWTVVADGNKVDLHALKFTELESELSFNLSGHANIDMTQNVIGAELTLNDLDFTQPAQVISLSNVIAKLSSNDSITDFSLNNRDLVARFNSPNSLDSLLAHFTLTTEVIGKQIEARVFNMEELQTALPRFNLDINSGSNNAITDILASSKMTYRKLNLSAVNDSTLSLDSRILGFMTGTTKIDTIGFGLKHDRELLDFNARVGNRPGTFDDWAHVRLDGCIDHNQLGLRMKQSNIAGKEGFDIGLKADIVDSIATLRLTPLNQIIGYQPWTINEDNFISLRTG